MLRSLYIKNYALIAEMTTQFTQGLNIITGETGAGKSIVLGAFGLLIGDRASSDVVRTGADKAVVEAEFNIEGNPRLAALLKEREIEVEQDVLIIRREVLARGTGRGFINDTPATAQLLRELSQYLVDLHGQHEHQSLLRTEGHIHLLDDYGGLTKFVEKFQFARAAFLENQSEIEALLAKDRRLREEGDLIQFQLEEIRAVSPKANEDTEIENELRVLENAEELRTGATELHDLLYGDEGSAFENLSKAKQQLEQFGKIDSALAEQLPELTGALASIRELARFLSEYSERIEFDPGRLDGLRQRALAINRLKRKYGKVLSEVIAKERELSSKIGEGEDLAELIAQKEKLRTGLQANASSAAIALSTARKQSAKKLAPQVSSVLKELGIEHSIFEVRFATRELPSDQLSTTPVCVEGKPVQSHSRGMDSVEFYLSTNIGDPPKPLAQVASGGEVSRIMLALKTLLAKSDKLPLMVFDEIDVGVSGRVAQKVGRTMKHLAKEHQIIAITHLSQIAAFADAHFHVEKKVENKSTTSQLRRLSDEEHVQEVARLIAGSDISKGSLEAAKELISEALQTA